MARARLDDERDRGKDERGAFSSDVIAEFGPVPGVEAWHVRDAGTDGAGAATG